jgi:MerR family transcriptional activator of bmr gene
MKKPLFSIGEISRIKNITVKALRFYEKIGLVKPSVVNPFSKYRYYSLDQFIKLDIIKASRAMDISPKDIKALLDKKDNQILLDFLKDQKDKALQKIEELKRLMTMIDAAHKAIEDGIAASSNEEIHVRRIPQRCILVKDFHIGANEEELLIQYSELMNEIERAKLIDTYQTGIIYRPDEETAFGPTEVFAAVIAEVDVTPPLASILPEGRYLCMSFHQKNVQERLEELNAYMAANHLDAELILQVDLLNNIFTSDNPHFEMQVLLKP